VETHGRFLIARFATPATPSEDGMSFTPGSVEGVVATDYDTLPFSWVCGDFPSGTVDFDGDGTEDLLMVVYDPTTSSACMGKDVSALQVIVTQGGKLKALEVARNLGICEVGLAPGGEKGEKPFVGARCEEGGGAKDLSFEWDGKAIVRAAGPTERNTQTGAKAPASYQCELRFHCTWMPTKDAAPEPEWEVWSIEVENGAIRAVTFTPACPARDPSMWKVDSDGTPVDGTWKTAKLAPMEPGAKKPKSPARELKHRLTAGKLELDTRDGPKICEPQ